MGNFWGPLSRCKTPALGVFGRAAVKNLATFADLIPKGHASWISSSRDAKPSPQSARFEAGTEMRARPLGLGPCGDCLGLCAAIDLASLKFARRSFAVEKLCRGSPRLKPQTETIASLCRVAVSICLLKSQAQREGRGNQLPWQCRRRFTGEGTQRGMGPDVVRISLVVLHSRVSRHDVLAG